MRFSSRFLVASSISLIVAFSLRNGFPACIYFQKHIHAMASLTLVKTLIHIFVQWLNTCIFLHLRLRFTLSISYAVIFLLFLAASFSYDFLASSRAITYLERALFHDLTILAVISISCASFLQYFKASYTNCCAHSDSRFLTVNSLLILNPLTIWLCP